MKVEGNILTIQLDLTKEFRPSSLGKTIIIASARGNVAINGYGKEAKVGLYIYQKKDRNAPLSYTNIYQGVHITLSQL